MRTCVLALVTTNVIEQSNMHVIAEYSSKTSRPIFQMSEMPSWFLIKLFVYKEESYPKQQHGKTMCGRHLLYI
jgi:hypothetical protein